MTPHLNDVARQNGKSLLVPVRLYEIYLINILFIRYAVNLNRMAGTNIEASRGAAAQCVTGKPTGCGFDRHSRRLNIYLNLYLLFFVLVSRKSAALSSATQHEMPPEIGRKRGMECLKTRFSLLTLLCTGYTVKLIIKALILSVSM